MKRALGKILCGATLLLGLPLTFTGCDEILGEWSKPAPVPGAPNTPTPSPTPTPASKTAGAISSVMQPLRWQKARKTLPLPTN